MNYDKVIELDNVTWVDCLELYNRKNIVTIMNDGRIINFTKETDSKEN